MIMMIIMMNIELSLSVRHCAAWFTDLILINQYNNLRDFIFFSILQMRKLRPGKATGGLIARETRAKFGVKI